MTESTLSDSDYLRKLSQHKCLFPGIRQRLLEIAQRMDGLKAVSQSYSDLRPRFDSYGQFDGYYS